MKCRFHLNKIKEHVTAQSLIYFRVFKRGRHQIFFFSVSRQNHLQNKRIDFQ